MSESPAVLVVVAGTGTEVGKTFVASALARELRRRGASVAARKPAQSFEPPVPPGTTDAEILASATGEEASDVCPPWRWYPRAMAPPMAAESMGEAAFSLQDLVGELRWPAGTEVALVELAGGLGSPQAADGDGADMVELLRPDLVVLVAGPGLGTLSPISLSARALATPLGFSPASPLAPAAASPPGLSPASLSGPPLHRGRLVVFINRFDPADELHRANKSWVAKRLGLSVTSEVEELAGAVAELLPKAL